MMLRRLQLIAPWLLLGCQLPSEKPAEAPAPKPAFVEAGPLPAEETPPADPAEAATPPADKPVEAGVTTTSGAPRRGKLPAAVVDEKLKSTQPGVQACYERALKAKPALRGTVTIDFVVGEDGKVPHAEATAGEDALADEEVVGCIVELVKKLEFPAPSGGRVFLSYPLRLEPPPAAP